MRDRRGFRFPGRPTWRLTLLIAALTAAGAFAIAALSAVGSGGDHHARGGQARFQRFQECMRAYGVQRPRRWWGDRPSRATLDRALSACRRYLPRRAQERLARKQRFRSCMSQHGVRPPREGGAPPHRRTFRRALRACGQYLPRRGDCRSGGFGGHRGPFGPGGPPPPGPGRFGMGPPPPPRG